MKICAMVDRSAGNESVGDMWTETAEFDEAATLMDVMRWAGIIEETKGKLTGRLFVTTNTTRNVRLSILQNPKDSSHE